MDFKSFSSRLKLFYAWGLGKNVRNIYGLAVNSLNDVKTFSRIVLKG